MKRAIIPILSFVILFMVAGCEKEDQMVSKDSLPKDAKLFISTYFADYEIQSVIKDYSHFRVDGYTVYLEPTIIIEFNRNGGWESVKIESPVAQLPEAIIPKSVFSYLAAHFKTNCVIEISKKKYGYEIELDNSIEVLFNEDGSFKSIDN